METRIIGIDLAVKAAHKAIVLHKESNEFVSGLISFHTDPAELDHVLAEARRNAHGSVCLQAVMEATGMAWYPIGVYLQQHGVELYRVTGQQVADLRQVYQRHAKSDRIDARILARLPLVAENHLRPLFVPNTDLLTLQRGCREVARLTQQITAIKNRLRALDYFAWPGLDLGRADTIRTRWLRANWYDPRRVCDAGPEQIARAWHAISSARSTTTWIAPFVHLAQCVLQLYGPQHSDYTALEATVRAEQDRWLALEAEANRVRQTVTRPLYLKLYPGDHLNGFFGIGLDSAAVYAAFIQDIRRFPSLNDFRGWSGLVPGSNQSGETEAKGLHVTQAGPDLLKATVYLNANVARQGDPQIAAIYFDQMMHKGKHHNQAVAACATHLLNRIYAVLRDHRPYQLRDVDGQPVTKAQARSICEERYRVPEEIRRRNNHRVRQARRDAKVEQRYRRRHEK